MSRHLISSNVAMRESKAEIREERDGLRKQIEDLKEVNATLKDEVIRYRKAATQARNDRDELQKLLDGQDAEIKKIGDQSQLVKEMQERIEAQRAKIQELEKQLEAKTACCRDLEAKLSKALEAGRDLEEELRKARKAVPVSEVVSIDPEDVDELEAPEIDLFYLSQVEKNTFLDQLDGIETRRKKLEEKQVKLRVEEEEIESDHADIVNEARKLTETRKRASKMKA